MLNILKKKQKRKLREHKKELSFYKYGLSTELIIEYRESEKLFDRTQNAKKKIPRDFFTNKFQELFLALLLPIATDYFKIQITTGAQQIQKYGTSSADTTAAVAAWVFFFFCCCYMNFGYSIYLTRVIIVESCASVTFFFAVQFIRVIIFLLLRVLVFYLAHQS